MGNNTRGIVRARCDSIGMVLRVLFWGYFLYVLFMLGAGIWMLLQPEDAFALRILDTGNGLAGFAFCNDGFEIDFARDMLNLDAANAPKLVYMLGFLNAVIQKLLTFAIVWNIRNIFRKIDENDTPFVKINCKAIWRIGVLVMLAATIGSFLLPTILGILHLGLGANGNNWWRGMLIGGVILALSYVFEYGTSLQIESDETL